MKFNEYTVALRIQVINSDPVCRSYHLEGEVSHFLHMLFQPATGAKLAVG